LFLEGESQALWRFEVRSLADECLLCYYSPLKFRLGRSGWIEILTRLQNSRSGLTTEIAILRQLRKSFGEVNAPPHKAVKPKALT
jgi:hypothetical protein